MMHDKYVDKIIDLYAKSKIEDSAKEEFHDWLTDDSFAEEKEEALFRLWEQTENIPTEETLSSYTALQARAGSQQRKRFNITIWKYAAAIAVIIASTTIFLFTRKTSANISFNEHFSKVGQTDTLILPDGSIVHTNSKTVIIYPESFGKDTRTVYLSGEANFKVEKNKKVPFIVKSDGFSVTALGTEFDVYSYPEDLYFKTTLISGSVKVQQDDKPEYILSAGDQFTYNKKTTLQIVDQVDMYDATAWQRGELVFKGVAIKEVLNVLERSHATTFQYKDGIFNDDKYNFRFRKDASISDIMDIIKKVADDFEYKQVGDSYYINSKN